MEAEGINWEEINAALPYDHSEESHAQRREMWTQFNVNDNKYLCLAEVDRGILDVTGNEDLFDSKRAINEAFYFAKDKSNGDDKWGPDYLEFREFRLFLQTLRQYYEFYQAFNWIDSDGDHRISKEEFCCEEKKETIEKWVGEIEDYEAEFDVIDTNEGGMVLFKEFIQWAQSKDLDLEDDIDSQAEEDPEEEPEEEAEGEDDE